jgi:hypothetical protein
MIHTAVIHTAMAHVAVIHDSSLSLFSAFERKDLRERNTRVQRAKLGQGEVSSQQLSGQQLADGVDTTELPNYSSLLSPRYRRDIAMHQLSPPLLHHVKPLPPFFCLTDLTM